MEEYRALTQDQQNRYDTMRAAGNSHTGALNHSKRDPKDVEKSPEVITAREVFGIWMGISKTTGLPYIDLPSQWPTELAKAVRQLSQNQLRQIRNSSNLNMSIRTSNALKSVYEEMRRNGVNRNSASRNMAPANLEDRNQALKDAYGALVNDRENFEALDYYAASGHVPLNNFLRDGVYNTHNKNKRYGSGNYGGKRKKPPTPEELERIRQADIEEAKMQVEYQYDSMERLTTSIPLPFETKGYRLVGPEVLKGAKPGDVITDKGYASVSHDPEWLGKYIGDGVGNFYSEGDDIAIMNIRMPEGTKGGYISAIDPKKSGWGNTDSEYEFVLARNTQFRILSVKTEGNKTIYETELVK